jgi:hypothetical protein
MKRIDEIKQILKERLEQNSNTEKYVFRFFFDYGACPNCLWSNNKKANEKYGYLVDICKLGISDNLYDRLKQLSIDFEDSCNEDYPPDPSPWTDEQCVDFFKRAKEAFIDLQNELGDEYIILFEVDEITNH